MTVTENALKKRAKVREFALGLPGAAEPSGGAGVSASRSCRATGSQEGYRVIVPKRLIRSSTRAERRVRVLRQARPPGFL
ncbi:hypothetical protein [Streptomyces sp. NBC_00847]|uniref:hypothetical protein n=1 Tax=unclassified Streptomyces TaxID=2593676 RepID=UPI002256FE48|nr:hypothetical protein [Streptomyces sp. NBC_00847]MCX4885239.1 hypothetical protein [Streptomyces sp. NBC_00847]MCX5425105.1 hypothetical protein [Streptomyces sp. NBC_00078]